jgi:hypothetical protein
MTTPCRHHWRIDKPAGPESPGTCIFCHEAKLFSNVLPYDPGIRFGGPSLHPGAIATSQSIHAAERRRFYEGEE